MMEAASPLASDLLRQLDPGGKPAVINESVIDKSDGVRAIMSVCDEARNDACTVLLPSADTVDALKGIDGQVGDSRDMVLVNAQWKRRSDFPFFGRGKQVDFAERFVPTFHCSNLMVEGEQVRMLRCYPHDWRVFLLIPPESDEEQLPGNSPESAADWVEVGTKPVIRTRDEWERAAVQAGADLGPIIGATELDDWPGGARQMMEAASPLASDLLRQLDPGGKPAVINESVIDKSDGVRAIMSVCDEARNDACTVLLPSADTVDALKGIDGQVGDSRDMVLVNAQWKRRSDFPFFGRGKQVDFAERFVPTFHCSNLMVEGEQVRMLRCYPHDWRVFLLIPPESDEEQLPGNSPESAADWVEVGTKPVIRTRDEWERAAVQAGADLGIDGGRLFDLGRPTYQEIQDMIVSREGYRPKSLSERAAAAFTFIKDTL